MWKFLLQRKTTLRLDDLRDAYSNIDSSLNILVNTSGNLKSFNPQKTYQPKARLPNRFFPPDHPNLGPTLKMIN